MTVKHYEDEFLRRVKEKKLKFLNAAGHIGVNQAVQNMHVDTGLLRNSIIYKIFSGVGSEFGNLPGNDGVVRTPKESDSISAPGSNDFVRIGSNVEYMDPMEKKFGRLAESMDEIRSGPLDKLVEKVFKI